MIVLCLDSKRTFEDSQVNQRVGASSLNQQHTSMTSVHSAISCTRTQRKTEAIINTCCYIKWSRSEETEEQSQLKFDVWTMTGAARGMREDNGSKVFPGCRCSHNKPHKSRFRVSVRPRLSETRGSLTSLRHQDIMHLVQLCPRRWDVTPLCSCYGVALILFLHLLMMFLPYRHTDADWSESFIIKHGWGLRVCCN